MLICSIQRKHPSHPSKTQAKSVKLGQWILQKPVAIGWDHPKSKSNPTERHHIETTHRWSFSQTEWPNKHPFKNWWCVMELSPIIYFGVSTLQTLIQNHFECLPSKTNLEKNQTSRPPPEHSAAGGPESGRWPTPNRPCGSTAPPSPRSPRPTAPAGAAPGSAWAGRRAPLGRRRSSVFLGETQGWTVWEMSELVTKKCTWNFMMGAGLVVFNVERMIELMELPWTYCPTERWTTSNT